jgi:hypothetical protein
MKNNEQTRMILQLDFPIAGKAAATIEKRAKRLQGLATKRGAKLRILIPGLVLYTSVLRALDIKVGPIDKKTGQPKYRIYRGKLNDADPKAKIVAKPAKAAKVTKAAKVAAKPARAVKAAKVERKPRVAKSAPAASPSAPAAQPPAAPVSGATAETNPPASPVQTTPALTNELADSSASSSPKEATHAKRS